MMIPDGGGGITDDSEHQNSASENFVCGVVEGFYGRPWTSDQRRKLFKRMNKMHMNTYIYAPKDDSKHRMYWRDLYTVEEADLLTALIESAENSGVTFVYALSPGLDMTYSSTKELSCLKRKLSQVASFGCKAFALLFDDIETEMCEADKSFYQSFAFAQVSVTNEVYEHLHAPSKFFFCPTEYCASRAIPSVEQSEYLTTVGAKLLHGIDVMWTGPKVISRKISIRSVEEVARVLQRPPLIWDNIHANDYDQKRLFLGPYDGRAPDLIPYLRGVLTNPNCEFECNFVALHTLSQWSRSARAGKKDAGIGFSSVTNADIKLETDGELPDPDPDDLGSSSSNPPLSGASSPRYISTADPTGDTYSARTALKRAMVDWHAEFNDPCPPPRSRIIVPYPISFPPILSPAAALLESKVTDRLRVPITVSAKGGAGSGGEGVGGGLDPMAILEVGDAYMQPLGGDGANGLLDSRSSSASTTSGSDELPELTPAEPIETSSAEPMDCVVVPQAPSSAAQLDPSPVTVTAESATVGSVTNDAAAAVVAGGGGGETTMQVDIASSVVVATQDSFSLDDVARLVDLFYLPFEHGRWAVDTLNDFHWIKSNAAAALASRITGGCAVAEGSGEVQSRQEGSSLSEAVDGGLEGGEWRDRSREFVRRVGEAVGVMDRLCGVANKALLYELFPYTWDLKAVLLLMTCFVEWLTQWGNRGYGDACTSAEREPWMFRGGLLGEFQRMLPFECCTDLLFYPCPEVPLSFMSLVRPYTQRDREAVYQVCLQTCNDGSDGTAIFPNQPDLIADKLVGPFLSHSPEMCFVVEDQRGTICGYVLTAIDAKAFFDKVASAWIPSMVEKYQRPEKMDTLSSAEEIIEEFHAYKMLAPDPLVGRHPSVVRINMLRNRLPDPAAPARALACAVCTLKVAGSCGLFARLRTGDVSAAEGYRKLGFFEIAYPDSPSDVIHMGRVI